MTPRRFVIGGALAVLFVGCLFPSFDDLKSNEAPAEHNRDDDDSSDADGGGSSSSGATSSGKPGTSSSSGIVADTGADTSTPSKKTISCGAKTCDGATQICCDNGFDDTECIPNDKQCDLWQFECDDFTDCPTGQRCCKPSSTELEVRCSASCNGGAVVCQPGQGCAPGDGTCKSDTLGGPPAVRVHLCGP